jgi:hypothetical protein
MTPSLGEYLVNSTAATAAGLFDVLSGCFEKVEEDVKVSTTRLIEGVWEDFIRGLEAVLGGALAEGESLRGVHTLLDELVTQRSGGLEALVEELKRRLSEELLRELESKVKLALEALEQALRLLHVLYLHSGDEWFLNLAMLLYASYRSRFPDFIYAVAGLGKFLRGEPEEALALAAYAARERLPRRPPAVKPWESPGEWARALELSYHYEVGMSVVAELLCEWGITDVLRRPE